MLHREVPDEDAARKTNAECIVITNIVPGSIAVRPFPHKMLYLELLQLLYHRNPCLSPWLDECSPGRSPTRMPRGRIM